MRGKCFVMALEEQELREGRTGASVEGGNFFPSFGCWFLIKKSNSPCRFPIRGQYAFVEGVAESELIVRAAPGSQEMAPLISFCLTPCHQRPAQSCEPATHTVPVPGGEGLCAWHERLPLSASLEMAGSGRICSNRRRREV